MSIESRPTRPASVSLSLILPGLNEEANIEAAVRRAVQALERTADAFEVIVIDDGSTDQTGAIADRLAAEDPRIRVLRNERNVNYGISLARGIAAARCDWISHNGMDLPFAPEDLPLVAAEMADADVVVVRRTSREAHAPWRKLTSVVNNLLLRLLFQPSVSDLNFVQFYRRDYAQSVSLRSTSPAFVTPELILRAERRGLRVREVTAEFRRRTAGEAHFGKLDDILWTLRDMLSLRLHVWRRGWNR